MNDPWVIVLLVSLVPLFCLGALRNPRLFLIATFALTPFQQALLGEESMVKLGVVDLVALLLCLPLTKQFVREGHLRLGPAGLPVIMFMALAVLSSVSNSDGVGAAVSIVRMVMATVVAIAIFANLDSGRDTADKCYSAFLVATNVLTVLMAFAFLSGGYKASMYTAGLNKNFIGPIQGCGVVVALVYLIRSRPSGRRRTWLVATLVGAAFGLVLSLSRGAWIATMVSLLLVLWATRNFRVLFLAAVIAVPVAIGVWQMLPEDATDYAGNVSLDSYTIRARLDVWDTIRRAFDESPIIGVGVNLRRLIEPHNVLVLTLGEMGILGVILFVAMMGTAGYTLLRAFRATAHRPGDQRIVLMAAAVFTLALAHGMMDVYWRRGVGFMGWAGVGIATRMLAVSQPRAVTTPRRLDPVVQAARS